MKFQIETIFLIFLQHFVVEAGISIILTGELVINVALLVSLLLLIFVLNLFYYA